ncbi:serine hydrolase [Parerythrobacter jejuensis]|uniref:Beta-lactamase n=1 Tax=Parerythrobacter jejuensis TaxID=795812 RepID=A0A845AMN8_9SPHN|nr:serine hydrolase [Parerythrobacter jejuensis]MXP30697.1 serine hydrolase [Parerythrobacter jejuensis]MXP33457.1 serine hydrolase [Parerythrobacter jejuensis]
MTSRFFRLAAASAALFAGLTASPAVAQSNDLEAAFDRTFGTQVRAPQSFEARYETSFERRIAQLADGSKGRIGVAAVDLSSGEQISILGNQRFPMASTSKIAVAATFLEGVEQGRWSLTSEFPLMIPIRSKKYSSRAAPVRKGNYMPAIDLIEIMITRSSNPATDALLKVVGGPNAVNGWARRNGIREFSIDRDIATLVRDDGEYDPVSYIDRRDSATPRAMVDLLAGLYQGKFLSRESRRVLMGAMSRTRTGKRRIPAMIPGEAEVLHKTGSLNNTSSDIGIIRTPDGRAFAVAIYVTGQGTRRNREAKIASIARALYDGYRASPRRQYATADYGGD